MKKSVLRWLCPTLAALTVLSMVGCGKQDTADKESESTKTKEASEAVSQESTASSEENVGGAEENAGGEITYPLENAQALSIWSSNQVTVANCYSDYTQSPFHTGLAKNTGVEMEWMYPAEGADATQAYNLLLTEDELPNIILKNVTPGEAEQLINDGVIYDLTEYLPLYAPDYWEQIHKEEYANTLRGMTTESGKFYGVEEFNMDVFNSTYVGPVIRQDWLDELGLEAPVTMDDWEKVLIAFNENYGAKFGFFTARFNIGGIGSGTGAYGTFQGKLYVDDAGKIQLAQAQDEWKDLMAYLNKWWDMGLIDRDSLTMDDAAMRTKVLNGEIGVSCTAISQLTAWVNDAEAQGTGAEWVGLAYPRTAPGEPTCMIQCVGSNSQGWSAMVTTSTTEEELITALKWLNYGFTEEGMMYWNFGTEGESYYLDENGEAQWTELITEDPDGITEARTKYTGHRGIGITRVPRHLVEIGFSQAGTEALEKWIENTEGPSHCVPALSLTDEENARYTDLFSAISTYVQEAGMKFMTGEKSLDEFDAYVKELKEIGLDEVLKIQQSAYDKFMNK